MVWSWPYVEKVILYYIKKRAKPAPVYFPFSFMTAIKIFDKKTIKIKIIRCPKDHYLNEKQALNGVHLKPLNGKNCTSSWHELCSLG